MLTFWKDSLVLISLIVHGSIAAEKRGSTDADPRHVNATSLVFISDFLQLFTHCSRTNFNHSSRVRQSIAIQCMFSHSKHGPAPCDECDADEKISSNCRLPTFYIVTAAQAGISLFDFPISNVLRPLPRACGHKGGGVSRTHAGAC